VQAQALAGAHEQHETQLREHRTIRAELEATVGQLKAQLEPLKAHVEASQSERHRLVTELEELTQAFNRKLSDFERVDDLKQELERQLADARARPSKASIDMLRYRLLSFLSRRSPPFSRRMTARFARSAQKRDPRRSLGKIGLPAGSQELRPSAADAAATQAEPAIMIDEKKPTILFVSHDATRSGAPVLALNLIAAFSERYNVVCLALGGGELTENLRAAAISLYQVDRRLLRIPPGASSLKGRGGSDDLPNPRILFEYPPPRGAARCAHSVSQNRLFHETHAPERYRGLLALSGLFNPCRAAGKMRYSPQRRRRPAILQ
jgi:regulator of replication initiation timing